MVLTFTRDFFSKYFIATVLLLTKITTEFRNPLKLTPLKIKYYLFKYNVLIKETVFIYPIDNIGISNYCITICDDFSQLCDL